MEPIDIDAFEALVADALEAIPDQLRAEMENVAIIIDDESPPGRLYGLYEGIPLTQRGTYAGARPTGSPSSWPRSAAPPARPRSWPSRVRVTLLHEVGHHFGLGEARLRERLGLSPAGGPRTPAAASSLFGGRAGVATGGVAPLVLAPSPRFSLRNVESSTSAAPMRLVAS